MESRSEKPSNVGDGFIDACGRQQERIDASAAPAEPCKHDKGSINNEGEQCAMCGTWIAAAPAEPLTEFHSGSNQSDAPDGVDVPTAMMAAGYALREGHPDYGPCDGMGPGGECSECAGEVELDVEEIVSHVGKQCRTLVDELKRLQRFRTQHATRQAALRELEHTIRKTADSTESILTGQPEFDRGYNAGMKDAARAAADRLARLLGAEPRGR